MSASVGAGRRRDDAGGDAGASGRGLLGISGAVSGCRGLHHHGETLQERRGIAGGDTGSDSAEAGNGDPRHTGP